MQGLIKRKKNNLFYLANGAGNPISFIFSRTTTTRLRNNNEGPSSSALTAVVALHSLFYIIAYNPSIVTVEDREGERRLQIKRKRYRHNFRPTRKIVFAIYCLNVLLRYNRAVAVIPPVHNDT